MGCSPSNSKTKVYSNTGLPQETSNISNKLPNLPSKGIIKRTAKAKVSRRREIVLEKKWNRDQRQEKG